MSPYVAIKDTSMSEWISCSFTGIVIPQVYPHLHPDYSSTTSIFLRGEIFTDACQWQEPTPSFLLRWWSISVPLSSERLSIRSMVQRHERSICRFVTRREREIRGLSTGWFPLRERLLTIAFETADPSIPSIVVHCITLVDCR